MKPLKEICEDKILKKHHDSMIGRFGGPVPVKKFLEEFLPAGKLPSPGRPGFSKIAQSRNSETACHALVLTLRLSAISHGRSNLYIHR